VLAARARIRARPVQEIIDIIARVAADWRRPESPWQAQALAALPDTTGFSRALLAEGLPTLFEPYSADHLRAFVEAETGSPGALDGFAAAPWGACHAVGPTLVGHISAGNVPGLAVPVLITAILAKSAVLVKPASGEPVLPALVARSLACVDADLGACVAVAYWPGGTAELDDILLARAEVVTVEGDDDVVAAVRARCRGRVLGFGRRMSLAVVSREATTPVEHVAAAIARDVTLYDQQGCLSPQVVYVEAGGSVSPAEVAAALGEALVALARDLPRGSLTPAEHAAIRRLREDAEWRAIAGEDVRIFGDSSDTGLTVVYDTAAQFDGTCLNRTVRVKPLTDLDDLPAQLGAWAGRIEAVGAAGPPHRIRRLALALAEGSAASRICPLGRMQAPPLGWHRGGVAPLGALLRWIDVEAFSDAADRGRPGAEPSGSTSVGTTGRPT
jgi:hypothetical protein